MTKSVVPPPGRIFISYRREETAYPAGWLFDRLAKHFGGRQVFKDVDSIDLGDDFVEVISGAVGSCDALLALIGDQWLTITDAHGRRRLDNPDDFVRLEIEAALTRGVRVIPILIDGARMPRADELPDSMATLVRRQALELSPNRFNSDTSRLLRVLDQVLADAGTGPASPTAPLGDTATVHQAVAPPLSSATAELPSPTDSASAAAGNLPAPTAGSRQAAPPAHRWPQRRIILTVGVAVAVTVITTAMVLVVLAKRTPELTEEGKRNAEVFAADQLRSFAGHWLNDLTDCTQSAPDTVGATATEKVSCSSGGGWRVNFRAYASIAERNKARDDRRNNYVKYTEQDLGGQGPASGVRIEYTEESIYKVIYWDDEGSPVSGDLFKLNSSFDYLAPIWDRHVE
jgi:hypothetical protein